MKISSKIAVGALSLALAFSVSSGVSAQTMSYADLIKAFVAAGIISADKAAMATALVSSTASTSFSKDLTVGSSGSEVSALQAAIGVTPATGYFGSVTKSAVMKFQASKGISATGFVGPLTRAALNGSGSSVVTAPVVTTPGTTSVVNSGVEGTLTVDRFSISNTTAYEGDSMVPVLAIKLQAKLSDLTVQRVKLDLGTSTSIYTKVYKTLYVVDDAGKVVAQADLNSNTVVKNDTQYEITFGGFSYVIAKDSSKVLTIKADVYSSVKPADQGSRTIRLAGTDKGVRAVDGAGIDQYAGGTTVTQSVTISTTLADSATMNLSTNSSNYKTTEVIASAGSSEDELDKLAVLAFDLKANKADLDVTDLEVRFTSSGSTATTTTAYLYDGSTLISTESINAGVASFNDTNRLFSVAKDATKTLTVKVDVRGATASQTTIAANVLASGVSAENASSESKTVSGSATGENMVIRNVGPVFSLVSKGISVSGTNNSGTTLSTSTITATFSLQIQALGGDISFGSQASATPMFGFKIYDVAGTDVSAAAGAGATTTGFTIPSSGVVTPVNGDAASFTLQENNTVTLNPITVTIPGKTAAGIQPQAAVSVGISSIKWIGTVPQTSTFMAGKTEWRTNTQTP
ncbi:MAG: trimeric autotransporter adhesin [Candidatus Parcubacteria bacterium]|jgi:peptidoglycan hydrolase-like protein with peptidoglycan-binding domain